MKMLIGRNLIIHTYNEDTANEIIQDIRNIYFELLGDLRNVLENIIKGRH